MTDTKIKRIGVVKTACFYMLAVMIGFIFILTIGEVAARIAENKYRIESNGKGELYRQDDILGYAQRESSSVIVTDEFKSFVNVNALGINGRPIESSVNIAKLKIMVVGDSHTAAIGVSTEESWPNVLEKMLFGNDLRLGAVYNCAVPGYSLGQYLLQIRRLEPILKPEMIIIGFSMATDLYDIIPPRLGGFVYAEDCGRVYFDLDGQGNLIQCNELQGKRIINTKQPLLVRKACRLLQHSALYRRLKRSIPAMWKRIRIDPDFTPELEPGMDVALKIKLDPGDEYRWRLAEQIIIKIAEEARKNNETVVLVNIPYIPQIYDDVWMASFGKHPEKYGRWIAGERLQNICNKANVRYVDTTKAFVEEGRRRKKWLHYKKDRHPTAEGQEVIAKQVYKSLAPIVNK